MRQGPERLQFELELVAFVRQGERDQVFSVSHQGYRFEELLGNVARDHPSQHLTLAYSEKA